MSPTSITIDLAEIQAIKGPGIFKIGPIGGGVAVLLIDPTANVAGCAHFVIPKVVDGKNGDRPGKHGDTAIPTLVEMLERLGGQRPRMVVALFGGAQCFRYGGEEAESALGVGHRNAEVALLKLAESGLYPAFQDLGGHAARSIEFHTLGGEVLLKMHGSRDKVVSNLRKQAVKAA